MSKTMGIVVGAIVVAVIVGVSYTSMKKNDDVMMEKKADESAAMADKETMMKDDGMAKEDSADMMKDDAMIKEGDADMMKDGDDGMMDDAEHMMKAGSYEAYAPEKLARAETGDVVLFFHASWCPSCRGLNADIEKNLDAIPSEVSILKVDYDTETALKKKYGITYQHTLVQVSADGTMIKKWSGSPTLSSLVSQIN